MPVYNFELYLASDVNFSGNTVGLASGYDGSNDVNLAITDDDGVLEGDLNRNEDGNDTNQFGFAQFANGSTLGGANYTVYSEEHYTLTAPDGSQITLYRIEMDSNPNSNSGAGNLVGYLPSEPLEPGVTYTFTRSNTTPSNDPNYTSLEGAVCFTAECLVETEHGPRRAGDLRPGDRVRTLSNGLQELRWVFCRKLYARDLERFPSLRPILFETGALGPDEPCRPMRLSPQHRVYIRSANAELMFGETGVLAPAKGLVNGDTIRADNQVTQVEYIHLLFDAHEVLYSDGVTSESFDPGAWSLSALDPEARTELETLFGHSWKSKTFHSYPALSVREARVLLA